MEIQRLDASGTGGKMGALEQLCTVVTPLREKALALRDATGSRARRTEQQKRFDLLSNILAELDGHIKALQLADLACHYGSTGAMPDNWPDFSDGMPYNAHEEIVIALEWAPGQGKGLSEQLLTFFAQLPREQSNEFIEGMNRAIETAPILSLLPENDFGAGLSEVTSKEIDGHADVILLDLVEKTGFLSHYNQEFAEALSLAKEGGKFEEINHRIN